jgi:hypothetical protein
VFQHIATETVSADIYNFFFFFFFFVFSENKKKLLEILFCKIIIKNGSGIVTLFQLLLQPLFQLLFQHHMFIHNCFLFANGEFRHHYTS